MNIGIYGRTNVGKSTLFNLLCGQQAAIVSPEHGTTTDPVRRRIEILDYAPVTLIDTAGLDDKTPLAAERIAKTLATLEQISLAIIVTSGPISEIEQNLISRLSDTPYFIIDTTTPLSSADEIFDKIKRAVPSSSLIIPPFFGDRLAKGDTVILVCPIDSEAPSGRLILPQVQAIRAALDIGATAIVIQPEQLPQTLAKTHPRLVVTDSQAFDIVAPLVPSSIELTSFSILLSELKGDKKIYSNGLSAINALKQNDIVLIIENCSHQTSCDDIGRSKIPSLLNRFVEAPLQYKFVTGRDPLPSDLSSYALAVQCGGCMTTRAHIQNRIRLLTKAGVPVTNYGLLLRSLLTQNNR